METCRYVLNILEKFSIITAILGQPPTPSLSFCGNDFLDIEHNVKYTFRVRIKQMWIDYNYEKGEDNGLYMYM